MTDEQKKLAKESGKRVKNQAKRKGLTQYDLSKESFCSVSAIRKIYQGDRILTEANAILFAEILGVRKEYLLCLDDDPTDEDRNKRLFRESVELAISSSRYRNQFLNDACDMTSYKFSGVVIDDSSADFVYRIKTSENCFIDFKEEEIDAWLLGCIKYAAFCVDLLVKEKTNLIKED